jgi:hypothetical protein
MIATHPVFAHVAHYYLDAGPHESFQCFLPCVSLIHNRFGPRAEGQLLEYGGLQASQAAEICRVGHLATSSSDASHEFRWVWLILSPGMRHEYGNQSNQ